jgi:hypothetical protein
MIPGPLVVIACPKCHAPAQLPTLESGNTFGAEVWTDGYMDAPMLPTTPAATRCHACKTLFWVEDAPRLGEIDLGSGRSRDAQGNEVGAATADGWRDAPEVRPLTKAQYHQALAQDELVTSEERERILRMLAWHASNAPRRRGRPPTAPDDRDRRNMERLLELSRAALFEAALTAAELARELGRFEDVAGYLALPFPEHMDEVRGRIAELAEARDPEVARLQ